MLDMLACLYVSISVWLNSPQTRGVSSVCLFSNESLPKAPSHRKSTVHTPDSQFYSRPPVFRSPGMTDDSWTTTLYPSSHPKPYPSLQTTKFIYWWGDGGRWQQKRGAGALCVANLLKVHCNQRRQSSELWNNQQHCRMLRLGRALNALTARHICLRCEML